MGIDDLAAEFERRVSGLARSLSAGEIDLARWQSAMGTSIRLHAVMAFRLGAEGKRLPTAALDAELKRQGAFLARWTDEIALKALTGAAPSESSLNARGVLYGGAARGQFYRASEMAGQKSNGWVSVYSARTDACEACASARGTYPVGAGPLPGEVCFGRGRCRCTRRVLFDPAAYAAMIGG